MGNGRAVLATGAIQAIKALYELRRVDSRYAALVTICIGGLGIAAIFERA